MVIALLWGFALLGAPLQAQTQVVDPDAPQAAVQPTPSEITSRALVIGDSVGIAMGEIQRLGELTDLRALLDESQLRQRELVAILESLAAVEHTRPERFLRLRDLALAQQSRLQETLNRISGRRVALATVQSEWLGQLATWSTWLEATSARPELTAQRPEIEQSIELIEEVLGRIDEVAPAVVALQTAANQSATEIRQLLNQIATLRAGRRAALRTADQPVLLSPAYFASLRASGGWQPEVALERESLLAFGRGHAALLALHFVLILVVGIAVKGIRRYAASAGEGGGILRHPWAVAIFGVTVILNSRYLLAPPLWDVVIWSLLAGSGGLLAATLLRGRTMRVLIGAVALFYPLLLLGEALHIPAPIFRTILAVAAATAVIGFGLLWRQIDPGRTNVRRAQFVLGTAIGLSFAVLVAQLLGFDLLSRWIVHAMLTTAYVVLTIAFILIIARGGLRALLQKEFSGRVRIVGRVAVPLAERLVFLLQVVLLIVGVLVVLDVWEVAPSPIETWRGVVAWGVEIGGIRVTVGRVIFAALLVYLAMTVSWLVRTILDEEMARSWSFERGVADSINTLVHYAVITVGVLFALGALGVELQNFAIVVGALGVGIGFGLQNVVNNFASGIILLFERPVRVGDTVEVEGQWGTIKKIGLRSTVVTTFSQAELILPNGLMVAEKVTNWTLSNPVTRIAIPVGVAYGSDVQKVLQILEESARIHPAVVNDPPPNALFIGFGDSSLDFELRIWIDAVPFRLLAKSAVLAEIDRRFREAEITIPFPQRDLHLRSVDPEAARAVGPGDRRGRLGSGPAEGRLITGPDGDDQVSS